MAALIVRSKHTHVCTRLSSSEKSLLLFSGKLYSKGLVDMETKNCVRRTQGYKAADKLMDYLVAQLENDPARFSEIISTMKEVELLKQIAFEMETSFKGIVEVSLLRKSVHVGPAGRPSHSLYIYGTFNLHSIRPRLPTLIIPTLRSAWVWFLV